MNSNYSHMCELCKFKDECTNPYKFKMLVECEDLEVDTNFDLIKNTNLNSLNLKSDRFYGALFGSAVGDALGVPVEFNSRYVLRNNPVTGMKSCGTHLQPMGTWSDDTSMMLCLVDALIQSGSMEDLDLHILANNFISWYTKGKFTANGNVFDVGGTCYSAIHSMILDKDLSECGRRGEKANGNGALMRILPLAFCDELNEKTYRLVESVATLTHNHGISTLGCLIYIIYTHYLYKGYTKLEALEKLKLKLEDEYFSKYLDYMCCYSFINYNLKDLKKLYNSKKFKSSGYVVDTLNSALLCFLFEDSFEDCVLSAVNLGEDTDTVGCVCGGMAGMYYGLSLIKPNWLNLLQNKKYLYNYFDLYQNIDFSVN